MVAVDSFHFKVSSGLKNLIGRELITDDFIAVFELVKNSYDARATEVKLIFEDIGTKKSRIVIVDNGTGMDDKDLADKWLFVAYSSKKTGEVKDIGEDKSNVIRNDYRDSIKVNRFYAGAKGVGRFSCDRLGSELNLITIKNKNKPKIENITIDWGKFELDDKNEFVNIDVQHKRLADTKYTIKHGTILEITNLRSKWDRDRLLALKDSLSKLIRPSINESLNSEEQFKIIVVAPEEQPKDDAYQKQQLAAGKEIDPRKVVNGPVKNFIFETLKIKTTQIITRVSKDGDEIATTLTDRGVEIYTITEKNKFEKLNNIEYHLFYLNQAAKLNFTKLMSVQPINYGNVFVYKNGFRVYPYGETRDDSLGLDARKTQGYSRFLGTRDLIGRIEIYGLNNELKESTSRDGGLIKTETYYDLLECFRDKALKRLEKYVVDTKNWGVDDEQLNDFKSPDSNEKIVKLISNITSDSEIINVKYNPDIVKLVETQQQSSAAKIIKNFKRIGIKSNNTILVKEAKLLEKRLGDLKKAKEEAEKESKKVLEERRKILEKLELEKKKSIYLLATARQTTPEVLGLIHHIELETNNIDSRVELLVDSLKNDDLDKDFFFRILTQIKLHSDKTLKISKLITRSNFNTQVEEQTADLAAYITEYIDLYKDIHSNDDINFSIVKTGTFTFTYRFSLIEISIVFDNLISNSLKAKAKNVLISMRVVGENLVITFSDDGLGVRDKVMEDIFDLGITTTHGSGIGLYTVRDLLTKMGADIKFIGNSKALSGASFEIIF